MAKLVGALSRKVLEPKELFDMCCSNQESKTGEISTDEFVTGVHKLKAGLYEREIRSIIRHLDIKERGVIELEDFMLVCKSSDALWKRISRRSSVANNNPSIIEKLGKNIVREKQETEIINKMNSEVRLDVFMKSLESEAKLTVRGLVRKIRKCYIKLGKQEIIFIAKSVPTLNGFVNVQSLYSYILEKLSSPQNHLNLYFQMLVSVICHTLETQLKDFLRTNGISENSKVNKQTFMNLITNTIKVKEDICAMMWKTLVEKEDEECPEDELLKVLESYQSIFNKKEELKTDFYILFELACKSARNKQASIDNLIEVLKNKTKNIDISMLREKLRKIANKRSSVSYSQYIEAITTVKKLNLNKQEDQLVCFCINKLNSAIGQLNIPFTKFFNYWKNNVISMEQLDISIKELISFEIIPNEDKRKIVKTFAIFWGDLVDTEQFAAVLLCNTNTTTTTTKEPELLKVFKNNQSLKFSDLILMLDYDKEGKVTQSNLMKLLKIYKISNEDKEIIYQTLSDNNEIELENILSVYDEIFYSEDDDKKVFLF